MPTTKSISQMNTKAIPHAGDLFEVAVEDQNSATGYASGKMTAEVIANGMLNTYNYPVAMPNMQTRTITGALNALLGNFSPVYDATSTYNENDLVTYEGVLYKANQDITVAEAWNSAHWTPTTTSESGGGGGGGNANEQVISMADYLALTEEERMNGTSYYIYDAQNDGKEIQPVIYSLEEREIGVWTDGKPLYQKTFLPNYTSPTHSSKATWSVNIDVHDLYIDTLASAWGAWQRWAGDDARLIIQFGSYEANNYEGSRIRIDNENGYTNGQLNLLMYAEGTDWQCVTIQYTKTTDVAGSGVWTTSGIPAVHYDGNEKVIGTWFGETLYERTFDCGQMGNNTTVNYNHGITDVSRIVEFNGLIYDASNPTSTNSLPVINGASNYIRCGADATKIWFKCQDSWSSYNALVTLRYTKTS